MATLLAKIIADFTTSLATEIAIGGTSATLQSATDDDGVSLPAGRYFFTIDGANSVKEHISADLSGTALTNIKTVSRQGTESAGVLRKHRIGATVSITDFAHIFQINKLLSGATQFNAAVPLAYDGVASLTPGSNEFATVAYADALAIAGAPDASITQKGIVEEATLAETLARTAAGATSARLFVNPSQLPNVLTKDYAADSVGTDAYAITITPAITAYVTGQVFTFKAGTANTGACSLNVSGLGAKTIKKNVADDLVTGDIIQNQIVTVVYDGTNMQMVSALANPESATNKSTDTALGASNTLYPSQAAVKTYVDAGPHFTYKNGIATQAGNSTTTLTIAHGLGRTPVKVRMTAQKTVSAANDAWSIGVYNGTTVSTLFGNRIGTASNLTNSTSSYIIDIEDDASNTHLQGAVAVDGTNITITWTSNGSPAAANIVILWEVE